MAHFQSYSGPTIGPLIVTNYAFQEHLAALVAGDVTYTPTLITVAHSNLKIEFIGDFTGTVERPAGTVTGFTVYGPEALGSPLLSTTTGLGISIRALSSLIETLDHQGLAARLWGGNDTLLGGSGHDSLYGGRGHDVLVLSNGDDLGDGWTGNDTVLGGAGEDTLLGWSGNDLLDGGDDRDELIGEDGRDTLVGAGDNDYLNGGSDNDLLLGGAGRDIQTGGAGADRFVFTSMGDISVISPDIITDYSKAEGDVIDLRTIDAKAGTPEFNDVFRLASGGFVEGKDGRYIGFSSNMDGQDGLMLLFETNGDAVADGAIFLTGVTSLADVTIIA